MHYKDFSEYMREKFPGIKVQKISVNAGFSCPNRDGTIGRGGCVYCDNSSFTPAYCFGVDGVTAQLEAGKRFFSKKYPEMKYLAYFQSFSNTFGRSSEDLEKLYREAMNVQDVVGLVIGTRPDTLPQSVVDMLSRLNREKTVIVEIGAESSHDATLALINRGHTWVQVEDAVCRLNEAGISVGLHLIAGLPGEDDGMVLQTVRRAVALPIESIKMHHLQVLRNTSLESMWKEGKICVEPLSVEKYIDLCIKIINLVPQNIAIDRFLASSPPEKVVAPRWGLKNYQFVNLLKSKLSNKNNKP